MKLNLKKQNNSNFKTIKISKFPILKIALILGILELVTVIFVQNINFLSNQFGYLGFQIGITGIIGGTIAIFILNIILKYTKFLTMQNKNLIKISIAPIIILITLFLGISFTIQHLTNLLLKVRTILTVTLNATVATAISVAVVIILYNLNIKKQKTNNKKKNKNNKVIKIKSIFFKIIKIKIYTKKNKYFISKIPIISSILIATGFEFLFVMFHLQGIKLFSNLKNEIIQQIIIQGIPFIAGFIGGIIIMSIVNLVLKKTHSIFTITYAKYL